MRTRYGRGSWLSAVLSVRWTVRSGWAGVRRRSLIHQELASEQADERASGRASGRASVCARASKRARSKRGERRERGSAEESRRRGTMAIVKRSSRPRGPAPRVGRGRAEPGAGEVRVKVAAVGVNPVHWKRQAGGGWRVHRRPSRPYPAWSSRARSTRSARRTGVAVGDEVFGWTKTGALRRVRHRRHLAPGARRLTWRGTRALSRARPPSGS